MGTDNTPAANEIDLPGVLLHELAHGLGFASYVNESTGALVQRKIDIFSVNILDNSSNKTWDEMSRIEIKNSAINTGNLVWDGQEVMDNSAAVLAKRPIM